MESAMDVFENRLESFTNWPNGLFLRPQVMAAAGESLLKPIVEHSC